MFDFLFTLGFVHLLLIIWFCLYVVRACACVFRLYLINITCDIYRQKFNYLKWLFSADFLCYESGCIHTCSSEYAYCALVFFRTVKAFLSFLLFQTILSSFKMFLLFLLFFFVRHNSVTYRFRCNLSQCMYCTYALTQAVFEFFFSFKYYVWFIQLNNHNNQIWQNYVVFLVMRLLSIASQTKYLATSKN